jgi:hypothetical protein
VARRQARAVSATAVIARFAYRHQAEYAANILRGAGIPVFLRIDDAGGLYAGLTFTNPARVIVRTEDSAHAIEVLADAGLLPDDGEGDA